VQTPTIKQKFVLFYFYFSFIAVVRAVLVTLSSFGITGGNNKLGQVDMS